MCLGLSLEFMDELFKNHCEAVAIPMFRAEGQLFLVSAIMVWEIIANGYAYSKTEHQHKPIEPGE